MPARFEMQADVTRRVPARAPNMRDHLVRTAEARRRRVEAIAAGVHRVWTGARRAIGRLRRLVLEPSGRRSRRRTAIAQLRALDDRLLADIGLTRGQIEVAVDGVLVRRGELFSRPRGRGLPAGTARDELPLAA